MMMIKNMPIQDLRSYSVEILSRTFLELRQHSISEDDIVSLSLILAEDLQKDFKNLEIVDDYAYMKRDIDAFKSIGGLDMVKPVKEYIIEC